MLCEESIYRSIDNVLARYIDGNPGNRRCIKHIQAIKSPEGVEDLILEMIYFLASYADEFYKKTGRHIGTDKVVGLSWSNILANIRCVLFGNIGRLDRKTLDSLLVDMTISQGFDACVLGLSERKGSGALFTRTPHQVIFDN